MMLSLLSQEYKSNYKKTIYLAFPVVVGQLGHVMVGVMDTAMVGQLGTIPQAAIALSNSIYLLVLVFGLGISFGVTPMVASSHSSKNIRVNSSLLKHSILVNSATGILLFVLVYFASPLLGMFDQEQEVVDAAIPFLNVMMLGMIPMCMFSGIKQFAEGLSFTKVAMYITVVSNLMNILLNYLLIFGKWGFPEMGLMGACWATFYARMAMAISMFLYVYLNRHFKTYWEEMDWGRISKNIVKKILSLGVPTGLQWVFEIGAFCFAVVMLGWISPEAQAAHQIALSIIAITYMMASGVSSAASVRVGNQVGLRNKRGVQIAGYSAFIMVFAFMLLTSILFLIFKDQLPPLFNDNPAVIKIAASFIVIAAFFQISDGLQSVFLGALRGLKDVRVPTIITLIAYWGVGLPVSYVFGFVLDMREQGVWYGLFVALTLASILLFIRFNVVSKRI